MVTVNENGEETQMKLSTDQQIHYKECSFREFTKDQVVVIQVARPHVVYDAEEHIVRYASANLATKQRSAAELPLPGTEDRHHERLGHQQVHHHQEPGDKLEENRRPTCTSCLENICESGRHLCTLPHMNCTPVERSYRCECVTGYHVEHDSSVQLGWRCVDVNECERGEHTCDRNAICTNVEGSFECRCREGYEGDGHHCQR
ncbi:unnamed protein product, partial [Gongylonema pulchrum]|uniref:EGF-like domain-containing protein n=1 Tax=Gongylonema pulchrum TaxID=637853 RepID=A0A183D6L8_9BILA